MRSLRLSALLVLCVAACREPAKADEYGITSNAQPPESAPDETASATDETTGASDGTAVATDNTAVDGITVASDETTVASDETTVASDELSTEDQDSRASDTDVTRDAGAAGVDAATGLVRLDALDPPEGEVIAVPDAAFVWPQGLGNWFVTTADGITRDATADLVEPPRAGSTKAFHVGIDAGIGVDLWVQLNHPAGSDVDLSAYSGIAFWTRLDSPSGELFVAFGANGRAFDSETGQISVPYSKLLAATNEWQHFSVLFDELDVDSTRIPSIDFVIDGATEPSSLWLDELTLLCRDECP